MQALFTGPLFGLAITIGCFVFFSKFNKKIGSPLANPILLSVAAIISFLQLFDIPIDNYNAGGDIITMFLSPVMAALAYSIYGQIPVLKKYFSAIIIGCFVGSLASMLSAVWLCRLFGFDEIIVATMIPKSVTTPIAIELSQQLGGIPPVTIALVIITGITGAIFAPIVIKLFRITDPVAAGLGVGTCSHGVGTSKALEIGPVEGATSGIAIGIAGFITVILALFF